jgi:hypothetical protein
MEMSLWLNLNGNVRAGCDGFFVFELPISTIILGKTAYAIELKRVLNAKPLS